MERVIALELFELALLHLINNEENIAAQRQLIERMRDDGHATHEAEGLLKELERAQELHVVSCQRLQRELNAIDPWDVSRKWPH